MNITRNIYLLFLICAIGLSTGCASIMGSPFHSVEITSGSQSASFSIVDLDGEEVASGTTPDTVSLRTSRAPFRAARYYVNFDFAGQAVQTNVLQARFSPWYFANIIFLYSGFVGMMIIDPFTGALYSLPNESRLVLNNEIAE